MRPLQIAQVAARGDGDLGGGLWGLRRSLGASRHVWGQGRWWLRPAVPAPKPGFISVEILTYILKGIVLGFLLFLLLLSLLI